MIIAILQSPLTMLRIAIWATDLLIVGGAATVIVRWFA